ncbi:hypothetical protein D6745_02365 [Candidatus Woesearchaeota archaeon]|nr:MAG: hypothetical protein D6745_02365 [Candidatus Woesearchaeota archaeon]
MLEEKIGCNAEYDRARVVLVHTPNVELAIGTECAKGSLFEGPLNFREVKKEHDRFKSKLRNKGIKVIDITDVLLDGTRDQNGNPVDSPSLDALREFANQSLKYDYKTDGNNKFSQDEIDRFEAAKRISIQMAEPEQLLDIILRRPLKIIEKVDINTNYVTKNMESPLYNLMFMRDQMITTDKGIVLGSMNSEQRRLETEIVKFVLDKIGIKPVYVFSEQDGKLEGGDFIPAGDHAFLGQGLRTNSKGVQTLLAKRTMSFPTVYIVKDGHKEQDEMHLDTYFNIVSRKKAVILKTRLDDPKTRIDVYTLQHDGTYERTSENLSFRQVLSKEGYSFVEFDTDIQRLYGVNLLTVEEGDFIGVHIGNKVNLRNQLNKIQQRLGFSLDDGISKYTPKEIMIVHRDYVARLQELIGADSPSIIEEKLLCFNHLNQAYGGPHCLTQVISRG